MIWKDKNRCKLMDINLNGVHDKALYLMQQYAGYNRIKSKIDIDAVRNKSKELEQVDIHYFPAIKYNLQNAKSERVSLSGLEKFLVIDEKKKAMVARPSTEAISEVLRKLEWHAKIIYKSAIINHFQLVELLNSLGNPYSTEIDLDSVRYTVYYYLKKMSNDEYASFIVSHLDIDSNEVSFWKKQYNDIYKIWSKFGVDPRRLEFDNEGREEDIKIDYENLTQVTKPKRYNPLKIYVYGAGFRETTYSHCCSYDGLYGLYLPHELKVQVMRYYASKGLEAWKKIKGYLVQVFCPDSLESFFTQLRTFKSKNKDASLSYDVKYIEENMTKLVQSYPSQEKERIKEIDRKKRVKQMQKLSQKKVA